MGDTYFISGIDTGVGKSVATGMMARHLQLAGRRVITVKLVQTGCHGYSEDLDLHRRLMGIPPLPEDESRLTAPQIFDYPASPHLAAALEGKTVDLKAISRAVETVEKLYDATLVEGAGGLAVPLTENCLTIDYVQQRRWPVILVTSGKLGAINHTILSLEALARRHMALAGVVYNYSEDAAPPIDADSPHIMQNSMKKNGFDAPFVSMGRVKIENPPTVDFSAIFREIGK
ncbi:MAG: dethiobiotin synthase [Lentisphaeria bacterium]|nr:dethiobiotin synthase [Lentisphaeria bacterium]